MSKKKGGIGALGPKAQAPVRAAVAPASPEPAAVKRAGPRGKVLAPSERPDRAVALTFKVSRSQHRILDEARRSVSPETIQALLLKAVAYYLEHEHGTKF